MKSSTLMKTALLVTLCATSAFAEMRNGGIYMMGPGGDGTSTLTITGDVASALYDRMTTPVLVGDPQVRDGYNIQASVKTGRDLTCTNAHFARIPTDGPGHGGGWGHGHRRPDSYTEITCETHVNSEGKIGFNFDHHGGGHHDGDHPGPGSN